MNAAQAKKLERLKTAQEAMATELASASELLSKADNDDDRSAAQKLHDEAAGNLEAARQEHVDYQAKLDEASSGAKGKTKTKAKSKTEVIEVVASADRRRAGRAFPKGETVEIPAADLTEKQLTALRDDPVLSVKE